MKTKVIGVTGGIGCGMTTVAQIMVELGGKIISGDGISRDIVQIGQPPYDALVKSFGKEILKPDNSIDRKKLGEIVFTNHEKLDLLNKTIHPFWIDKIKTEVDKAKQNNDGKVIILDAAILLETGLHPLVDKLIVVTAPIRTRRERIRARDFLDECQIDQRIAAQIPITDKAKEADFVIENTGTLEQTKQKINQIWNDLIAD